MNTNETVYSILVHIFLSSEEWKEITEKLSKATSAKCEAQAKLSDLQSSQVTTEVHVTLCNNTL